MIKNVKYVKINGGSHGITWTRAEEINTELVRFLAQDTATSFTKRQGRTRHRIGDWL
jgi:hypothetical protein